MSSPRKEENEGEDLNKGDGERACNLLSSLGDGLNASALHQKEGMKDDEERKETPSLRSPVVHNNKRTRKGDQKKVAATSSSSKNGKRERSAGFSSSSSSCTPEKGFAPDVIMVR